ncbi:hypothetical protein PALI_a1360 [Pseudoalteromonas aliena SW19]|uniref:Uncharacterized protein n=1 Tax=Pseudoalteromonas aliena SW19 TaxID=1314866 RepID=A0ABR9E081_9GAMM|nr:hypothetical protein [Pseudoalteromonas aliena SW19]
MPLLPIILRFLFKGKQALYSQVVCHSLINSCCRPIWTSILISILSTLLNFLRDALFITTHSSYYFC